MIVPTKWGLCEGLRGLAGDRVFANPEALGGKENRC